MNTYTKIRDQLESHDYLLHGSPVQGLSRLTPAVPINEGRLQGLPGVYATENLDLAIFVAIIYRAGNDAGWYTNTTAQGDQAFRLYASPNELEASNSRSGSIYLVKRSDFVRCKPNTAEFMAQKPVVPIKEYRVTQADLQIPISELIKNYAWHKSSVEANEIRRTRALNNSSSD